MYDKVNRIRLASYIRNLSEIFEDTKFEPVLQKNPIYYYMVYLIYPQFWYLLILPELFYDPINALFLSAVLLSYVVGILDTYFRPFSETLLKDASTNPLYNIIILILFILNPILLIGAFQENRRLIGSAFPVWDNHIISLLGLLILSIGGFITI